MKVRSAAQWRFGGARPNAARLQHKNEEEMRRAKLALQLALAVQLVARPFLDRVSLNEEKKARRAARGAARGALVFP